MQGGDLLLSTAALLALEESAIKELISAFA